MHILQSFQVQGKEPYTDLIFKHSCYAAMDVGCVFWGQEIHIFERFQGQSEEAYTGLIFRHSYYAAMVMGTCVLRPREAYISTLSGSE
jgi:hypothetical protein